MLRIDSNNVCMRKTTPTLVIVIRHVLVVILPVLVIPSLIFLTLCPWLCSCPRRADCSSNNNSCCPAQSGEEVSIFQHLHSELNIDAA